MMPPQKTISCPRAAGPSLCAEWVSPSVAASMSPDRVPEHYGMRFCKEEDWSTVREEQMAQTNALKAALGADVAVAAEI